MLDLFFAVYLMRCGQGIKELFALGHIPLCVGGDPFCGSSSYVLNVRGLMLG